MTTIYVMLAIIILWQIGADIRYYQVNKKIKIMHNTDKNLLNLVNTVKQLKDEKEKEEDKPKVKRNNKKRIIKKSKRVRTPKVSS